VKVVRYAAHYQPQLVAELDRAGLDAPLLRIESYVRHYFLSYPGCQLHLLLNDQGRIAATLGSEQVKLRIGSETVDAAVLSNTCSLLPGAFPLLFLQWMKSSKIGLAFPGNALLQHMFAKQARWRAIPGLRTYWLNWGYPVRPADPIWKKLLKPWVRRVKNIDTSTFAQSLRGHAPTGMVLHEESRFDDSMLCHSGAFGLHLEPDSAFLNWRFNTALDYVQYRIFRIQRHARACGYVVIAEWPHCLVVSHGDGDDAQTLAYAILLAIACVNQGAQRYRKVLLSSMHADMLPIFLRFGFAPAPRETPFYMQDSENQAKGKEVHSDWLINLELWEAGIMLGRVYKPL
jgi:hypothetical protein